MKNTSELTDEEVREMFESPEMKERFPPILTVKQAAELASVPVKTVYDWSSRGLLSSCASRFGRRLRINRNRFVKTFFENKTEEN